MEINGVSSKAYTSASAAVEEEEELQETQEENATEEAKEYGVATKQKEEKDTAEFSKTDYDESDVEEKASNFIQNILFVGGLTDEAETALTRYINTFDAAKFIKSFGPFSSSSEISAAMYAVTAGMIKYQDEE